MSGSFPFAQLVQASDSTKTEVLVRAAQIVATAIGHAEFAQWCGQELAGYTDSQDVPEYRKVHAQLFADDAFRTGVPALVRHERMAEVLGKCPLPGPLRQIDEICGADRAASFQVFFSAEYERKLLKAFPGVQRLYRIIEPIAVRTVAATIRGRVFDWALPRIGRNVDLPGGVRIDGMLGIAPPAPGPSVAPIVSDSKGLTFEIQGSGNSVVVQSSNVQSSATIADPGLLENARELAALLSGVLREQGAQAGENQQLREAVAELKSLVEMPRPRTHWIMECVRSIRAIGENTAGGIAASLVTPHGQALLEKLLRSLGA